MISAPVITSEVDAKVGARRELARRELARRRFLDFETFVDRDFRPARHHRLVAEYLEQVETFIRSQGETGIGRLLILEPPRYWKSTQASRHFPTWVLGRMPDTRVIVTSYGADLAAKFSRAGRDIVLGSEFRAVFGELASVDSPVTMSGDSRSVTAWDLAAPHKGGMISAGVGGGITGSGANLLIVDDPFKNREEAENENHREKVWEWWTSTAYTRLERGGAVIGCLTRWHGDDWAGRVIKEMANDPGAERWVVLCLPAVWELSTDLLSTDSLSTDLLSTDSLSTDFEHGLHGLHGLERFEEYQRMKMGEGVWVDREDALGRGVGEALWPEVYPLSVLEVIRKTVGPYDWAALYQQSPYSRQGGFFRREWFTIIEAAPKKEEVVSRMWFWDKAGSQSGGGDYAAGGVMSLTKDDLVVVENVARRQCTPGERDRMMVSAMRADVEAGRKIDCIWHQQDPGSAGLDSAQATNRMLLKEGFGTIRFETVSGTKEVRAGPWSSALEGGQIRLVRGGWNQDFIEEHVGFPKATFDDQVDFASWGFVKLMGKRGKREARSYQG